MGHLVFCFWEQKDTFVVQKSQNILKGSYYPPLSDSNTGLWVKYPQKIKDLFWKNNSFKDK